MTDEQRFFIRVLSDHLNGRQTEAHEDLDWAALRTLADIHQVSGIVYHQCKAFIPKEMTAHFEEKHAAELFYYYNRATLFNSLASRISAEKIPFYTVKGLTLAQLYPIPALRTMSDCDIIVHPEDKNRLHEIMLEQGFTVFLKEDKDWMYDKGKLRFEIHDHLLYDEPGNARDGRDFVDHAWEYVRPTGEGSRCELDWSFHFLFLLLHLKKHLIHAGVGFRQFMDLAVVMQKRKLDWAWITDALRQQGLLSYAKICLFLIERWFGVPTALGVVDMDEAALDDAAAKIFASGIFGFNDENSRDSHELNAIARKSGPRWLIRTRLIVGSVFPSYHNMRFSDYYAFLDGRPYLLPAAWVYRWYRAARYRLGDNGKRMIGNALISDERLDAHERELQKWGL